MSGIREKGTSEVKLIAYYLSQYHQNDDNDRWWGKGFTDWVNVKKAEPLFIKHRQPRIPLGGNYYDLSDIEVMRWQVKIAKEYGIYGFCFYHYWFEGKLLLEKPIEQFLQSDIAFPFCFMWANETWTRTWNAREEDVLLRQTYSEKYWDAHFKYLLPFFLDERYIQKDGMPVFLLYRAKDIPNVKQMIDRWNQLAWESGLAGIYFIQADDKRRKLSCAKNINATTLFEPRRSANEINTYEKGIHSFVHSKMLKPFSRLPVVAKEYYDSLAYNMVYQRLVSNAEKYRNRNCFYGAFVNWDNTPRKQERGEFFRGGTPDKFEEYLYRVLWMSQRDHKEFVFLFAWNEWAEGAYLEPDTDWEYAYLEAVRRSLGRIKSFLQ